ncbi:hypothetical protein DB346_14335 [Verrucomicrobia bacterium LW23]|nr:hypothetical protein DB346_14335 [Verrucomicrobia bacterium LW23]
MWAGYRALCLGAALAALLSSTQNVGAQENAATNTPATANAPLQAPAVGKWEPLVRMDNQLYPSYVLATATLTETAASELLPAIPANERGERNGQLGVEVEVTRPNTTVGVEIRSTRYVKLSSQEFKIEKPGTYRLFPTLEWNYHELRSTRETTPETVTFTVLVDSDEVGSQKRRITVRSLNDCPFGRRLMPGEMSPGSGEALGMPWMFAAYVNEGDPTIDLILKEALATGIINRFVGYQAGRDSVAREVFAIWAALRERKIRYSNTPIPAGFSQSMTSQYVRFMGESLNYQQSNCVDGSALILAVLRKLGIEGSLMLVPGHCLIAVELAPDQPAPPGTVAARDTLRRVIFIETTAIGEEPEEKAFIEGLKLLGGNVPRGVPKKYAQSYRNFVGAIAAGQRNGVRTMMSEFGADVARDNIAYTFIDIGIARRMGIQPVSYLQGETVLPLNAEAKDPPKAVAPSRPADAAGK